MHRCPSVRNLHRLGVIAGLSLFAGIPFLQAMEDEASRLALLGRSLYQSHCYRCHGEDGDATDYYHVIPLAGIARRPPVGLVGRFRLESFSARGVEFSGDEAAALRGHLHRLPGSKGYRDPGWLWSPYLLHRKTAGIRETRIVDVRSRQDYRAGHVPNAVFWPLPDPLASEAPRAEATSDWIGALGIDAMTQVIVYDRHGGPDAAWVWWRLIEAGHPYVAVLDGGWDNWIGQGFPVATAIPSVEPPSVSYRPAPPGEVLQVFEVADPPRTFEWDGSQLRGPRGVADAESVRQHLEERGLGDPGVIRIQNSPPEGAFLTLLWRLLGDAATLRLDESGLPLVYRPPARKELE